MGRNDLEKFEATNRLFRKSTRRESSQFQILKKGNEHPAWLPDGWNVGFKTRKSGVHKGAIYKCFSDPLNRFKFYSKPEVLRYLETIDGSNCTFKKGCPAKQSTSNESSAPKRQKVKHSAIKQQLSAGKEVSDGVLELSGACSSKEGQNMKVSAEFMVSPVLTSDSVGKMHLPKESAENNSEIKQSNPANDVHEKNYFMSGVEKTDEGNPFHTSISKNKKELNVPQQNLRQLTGKADQLTSTVTHEPARRVSRRNFRKSVIPIGVDLKNKSSQKQKPCEELLNKNSNPDVELAYRDQPYQLVTEKIDDKEVELECSEFQDSSAQSLKVEMKNITCELPARDVSHRDQRLASDANVMKEDTLPVDQIGKSDTSEIHVNLNKYSDRKDHCNPCRRASKRLAGLEPEVTTNSIVCKRAPEYKSRRPKGRINAALRQTEGGLTVDRADNASTYINMPLNREASNKNLKSPEILPITHEQPEKHGNEEIDYEKSEPQQSIASQYSRSDPCLEFAMKTLTGELPVENSIGDGPNLATDAMLFDGAKESSSERNVQVNSKKLKSKEKLKLPRRLSRRLAGHKPEVMPALRAVEYATRKSCQDKSTATVFLKNGVSQLVGAGKEIELTLDASNNLLKSNVLGESLNKSETSYEVQNFPEYQQQKLETDSLETRTLKETSDRSEELYETQTVDELNESVKLFETLNIPTEQQQELETVMSSEAQLCLADGEETERTLRASASSKTEVLKDTSNRSVKSYESQTIEELLCEDQTVANEQQQKLGGSMSEPQTCLAYEQFWSDPCLEFAIKTLTGTLPVDDAANVLPVMTTDNNDQTDKELLDGVVKSPREGSHDNLNQSENDKLTMPKQTQLRTGSTFCQNRVSCGDEADLTRNLNEGEPLCMEDVNTTKLLHQRITGSTVIHEELPKKIPQVLDVEAVPSEQPQLETEIMSHEKPEAQFRYPFMDSWSDPSLEFAFKTLTGAITIEEDLPTQGCLEETAIWSGQRDSYSSLPDFGPTSFSQSDISSYCNMEERSIAEQQPQTSLGAEVDPQKYHSHCNRKISR
ncbi:uncharacterized protein LOC114725177 isoform X1 [Neltuma alba]|uniref:uncharacterized protein LOC114725177 isoform X1 n=1 Tax=Neltuma alba TaxID=207710 RepID=UPI0010A3E6B7|nr:uncharacterized protein LOC114725177 isoform X1 [Prosopis alba]XP_028767493.1 uncharacterized protein LOC114725177 isoform X1 [Prosopis alba]XP_028767494.1 uncharacterized protein LOC114725177 isoform X1 [Prosopis alba]XP_028767495.1 uncharacterized protein LOC114725177 isoform X1 [Prosopis alba]